MLLIRRLSSSAAHINFYDKYAKVAATASQAAGIKVNLALTLPDVLKLEKLEGVSSHTMAEIWRSHFEKKSFTTGLALPESPFSLWWFHRARQSPTFVVPLKVGEGVCNFMVQHAVHKTGGCAVFATLDDFQRYRESAPARMTANCFGDLLESKKIGLIKTQFDGSLLTRSQADLLLQTCIDFYTTNAYQWVHTFNHEPEQFNYGAFLEFFSARSNKS